jgi:hypothetical protein
LGVYPDRDAVLVALQAFSVADELIKLLDAPAPGEDGSSLLSEFEDSPQMVADAILGRGEVSVPVDESLQVDIKAVDEEFL